MFKFEGILVITNKKQYNYVFRTTEITVCI